MLGALKQRFREGMTKVDGLHTRDALKEEIDKGLIEVETEGQKIIIRIREKGSFSSGSAQLLQPFEPVMLKIAHILKHARGRIGVAGHTDDVPISN